MGLVDYGSDSEEESIPAVKVTPLASTKRAKGPVRILLDLPKPTASPAIQEPPQKRAKFTPSLSGTSALSQMLPAPKHESVATKLQKSLAQPSINHPFPLSTSSTTSNNALVPHTIQKSQKAAQQQAATDFFGLGTVTASTSTLPPVVKKEITISSAPAIKSSDFGAAPTASDPYPGFIKNAEGIWEAKDQATYDLYRASLVQEEAPVELPKGFDSRAIGSGNIVDVDAGQEREAWENRPDAAVRPGTEDKSDQPVKKNGIILAKKGKARHQLSSLLADAVTNRAELEERFAVGRANRRSAGNKYGF